MHRYLIFMVSVFILSMSAITHAETEVMTVNVEHAFIREAPRCSSPDKGAVNMGDSLEVINKGEKWIKVRRADGRIGYVFHKLLESAKEKTSQPSAKIDAKIKLQADEKGRKPAGDGKDTIPQNLSKSTPPATNTVPAQPKVAYVQPPAAAPVIKAALPKTLAPVNPTPAPSATNAITPVIVPVVPATAAPPGLKTVPPVQTTQEQPPLVASVINTAAVPVIKAALPENKNVTPAQITPQPTPEVAPTIDAVPSQEDKDLRDHSAEEVAQRDQVIEKLRWQVYKLTQEKEALRAQLRQYKFADAADKNSERVFLRGVGETEMIKGDWITTFKVPLSLESTADRVFAPARPDKLVKEGFAYYSAPSGAFR